MMIGKSINQAQFTKKKHQKNHLFREDFLDGLFKSLTSIYLS
jgi:hypothetical protein